MDQYGVEIRFPRNSDPDPNLVVVSGKSEDAVYDCIDHLRNVEEEYLQVRKESLQNLFFDYFICFLKKIFET